MEPLETITVDKLSVACDGGGGALGHPRVFLNLERHGAVDFPYCGRRFVLAEDADVGKGIPAPEHDLPPAV
ncbi:MAG: zinc-finger domain-containing protein [Rhodospirillaceae bacterium]|nr:zinc-finger domain-containing protein [Rhodospirillaceae bacterium]